jgi:hypothetical protein
MATARAARIQWRLMTGEADVAGMLQRLAEAVHLSGAESVNPSGTGSEAGLTPGQEESAEVDALNEARLSLANDFSAFPGGADSAREFLIKLVPLLDDHDRVVISLDGVAALPASFLKHVFHALVEEHGVEAAELNERVKLEATDPELQIYLYIAEKYAREEAQLAAA